MRKIIFMTVCLFALAALPVRSEAGKHCDQPQVIDAARYTLELLDNQDVEGVWTLTSPLFRELHDELSWKRGQLALRLAYGAPLERKVRHFDCRSSYFHAPDGTYAIIQFDTVFSNKAAVVETIVIDSQEPDAWLIADIRLN